VGKSPRLSRGCARQGVKTGVCTASARMCMCVYMTRPPHCACARVASAVVHHLLRGRRRSVWDALLHDVGALQARRPRFFYSASTTLSLSLAPFQPRVFAL
jgi:hypothetical protein